MPRWKLADRELVSDKPLVMGTGKMLSPMCETFSTIPEFDLPGRSQRPEELAKPKGLG